MGRYLVRRLFGLVGVLLGITLLTFVISHMIPADPAAAAAGKDASARRCWTAASTASV